MLFLRYQTYLGLPSSNFEDVPGFFDADLRLEKNAEGFVVITFALGLLDESVPKTLAVDFASALAVAWRASELFADFEVVVLELLLDKAEAFLTSDRAVFTSFASETRGLLPDGFVDTPFEVDFSPAALCFVMLAALSRICCANFFP